MSARPATTVGLLVGTLLLALAGAAAAQQREAAKDCANCPDMLEVAGGSFVMGAAPGEEERERMPAKLRGWAEPQHRVAIAPFRLARFPVTRDEFAAFASATGQPPGASCLGLQIDGKLHELHGVSWTDPGFLQGGDHPAVCVSWIDAEAYAGWLARTTGKHYRLPSEAEWEYAARAGTTTARFWGEGREGACRHGNVADETFWRRYALPDIANRRFACRDGHIQTAPVSAFEPNPWGFHDMLGNVWQWTADCWHPDYNGAPPTGAAWLAQNDGVCEQRMARGGSWLNDPWYVRAADRDRLPVGHREVGGGIRVARDP